MYHRLKSQTRPIVYTKPLEQSLEKSYASLQSQMDILTRMIQIFGERPTDRLVAFQMQQLRKSLTEDIGRIARTGTDIHDLQERVGSDVFHAQVLNARKTIEEDKTGGQISDMVDDERLAEAEREELKKLKPQERRNALEYLIQQKLQDASLAPLLNYYMGTGLSYEKAYRKALSDITVEKVKAEDAKAGDAKYQFPMPTEPVEKEPFDFERAQQETKELVEQRRIADEERKAKAAEERKAKAEADEERKAKAEADEERKAKAAEKKLDPRIEGMAERYEKEKKPNPAKKKTQERGKSAEPQEQQQKEIVQFENVLAKDIYENYLNIQGGSGGTGNKIKAKDFAILVDELISADYDKRDQKVKKIKEHLDDKGQVRIKSKKGEPEKVVTADNFIEFLKERGVLPQ